jgi:hypothetical protein
VPLDHRFQALGWVLDEPLIAFLDKRWPVGELPDLVGLGQVPIAFRVAVMNHAVTRGTWKVVGHLGPPNRLIEPPWFFNQDGLTGEITLTQTGAEEVPADLNMCQGLEAAAVWEPEHIVDRLRDHFAGRPNKWVESLRPKPSGRLAGPPKR